MQLLVEYLQTKLKFQLDEILSDLHDLQDWVRKAEHEIGSEQPMSEQIRPLNDQLNKHKVRASSATEIFLIKKHFNHEDLVKVKFQVTNY